MRNRDFGPIFSYMTGRLFGVLALLAVVGAVAASWVLGTDSLAGFLAVLGGAVAAVAGAWAFLAVVILVLVDAEPIERVVNAAVAWLIGARPHGLEVDELVGREVVVSSAFYDEAGRVQCKVEVGAERWNARLSAGADRTPIVGERVRVTAVDGLTLFVAPC